MIFWAVCVSFVLSPAVQLLGERIQYSLRVFSKLLLLRPTCHKVYVALDLGISNDSKHVVLNWSNIVDAQESCLPGERYVRKVAKQIVDIAHIVESMPTFLILKLRIPD